MLSRRLLRIKVVKEVYAHMQCESDNIAASEKNLVASIDKAYELYFQMLALAPELVRYAEQRQEIGRNKKLPTYEDLHPNRKFIENRAIARIDDSADIAEFCKKHRLGWHNYSDLIKSLYTTLCEQEFYQKYMASEERSFKEDVQLLSDIYMNMLEENEALDAVLEEQSILWSDDLGYILTMVARTVGSMREKQEEIKLMPEFKSEEDLDFAKRLLRASIVRFNENKELIDRFASNWDIERVALMDNIILDVAISEAETFPSIPLKVTLNEYIDIAKYYSSTGSSTFINGVLDKVTSTLVEEGKIQKSGKGLL